jgi:hypothetical protein
MSNFEPHHVPPHKLRCGVDQPRHTPKRDASDLAALHVTLQDGLASLNRRLFDEGANVVAYSTWFDSDLGRDVIVLLWRTPVNTGPRDHAAIRRYMEASDEELGLIDTSVIAHQLLGPGSARERPPGTAWIEVKDQERTTSADVGANCLPDIGPSRRA